jgi:hypothetical protein
MTLDPGLEWREANQRYLMAALAVVRLDLERCVQPGPDEAASEKRQGLLQKVSQIAAGMSPPPVLDTLCSLLDLSPFERDLLLLCAGIELDGELAQLTARAQGNLQQAYPTVNLALAALNNPHWSALTPNAPLRRWKLIEVGAEPGLRASPLHIDEQVPHALAGVQQTDHRLLGIIYPVGPIDKLVPTHRELAQRIAAVWSQPPNRRVRPVVQLCGEEIAVKRDVTSAACGIVGLELNVLPVYSIPTNPNEVENLARLLEREALLGTAPCCWTVMSWTPPTRSEKTGPPD